MYFYPCWCKDQREFIKIFQYVNYFVVLNEPNVYAFKSYLEGTWPPQERSLRRAFKVINNLKNAYLDAYKILKNPKLQIGIAQNIIIFKAYRIYNPLSVISTIFNNKFFNFYFLDKVKKLLDFVGVNYYTRVFIKFFLNFEYKENAEKNCLGWEIYPRGLYEVCKMAYKRYKKPIIITENGICTNNDYQRINFIKEHISYLKKAIAEGIKILGYMYWSFLDNYEWAYGFEPRFGIVEVDYETGKRKVKPSGYFYKEIIEEDPL